MFPPLLRWLDACCLATSFHLLCSKEEVCFHIPMPAPTTLILTHYHHLLWFYLKNMNRNTKNAEYCAVFSSLLGRLHASCVCTSFLLLCYKKGFGFHIPKAAPSTLILPLYHHLLLYFLKNRKWNTSNAEYYAMFSPLMGRVDASCSGTCFLLLCSKELVCLHIPVAAPSTLILPLYLHLLCIFL